MSTLTTLQSRGSCIRCLGMVRGSMLGYLLFLPLCTLPVASCVFIVCLRSLTLLTVSRVALHRLMLTMCLCPSFVRRSLLPVVLHAPPSSSSCFEVMGEDEPRLLAPKEIKGLRGGEYPWSSQLRV